MNKILYHLKPGTSNFFLGDFPEELKFNCDQETKCDFPGDNHKGCKCDAFEQRLQACKKEAIKNGEIVNPELLQSAFKTKFGKIGMYSFKDGDIFDLPEGLSFEKDSSLAGTFNFIRLVPIQEEKENADKLLAALSIKEESQEYLFLELYHKMKTISFEELMSQFTIIRN